MKKLKKLLSIVLAVAMVMSLAVSVTADELIITINNAVDGQTYTAYKIFDVVKNGDSYAYTIDSTANSALYDWLVEYYDAANGKTAKYFTFASTGTAGVYSVTPTDDFQTTNTTAAASLAAALKAAIDSGDLTPATAATETASFSTANAGEVTTGSLTLDVTTAGEGYYFINTSTGALAELSTYTEAEASLTEKNSVPSVEKEVCDTEDGTYGSTSDAAVGDTVYFQTTIDNLYGIEKLTLHDDLDDGLTLDTSSIDVYFIADGNTSSGLGTAVDNQYYDLVTSEFSAHTNGITCDFEITLDKLLARYSSSITTSSIIVVTYSAELNDDAVVYSSSNDNTTYIVFGNTSESEVSKTKTYTYSLNIYKYSGTLGNSENKLDGAEFIIMNEDGTKYAQFTKDSDGNYVFANWVAYSDDDSVLTNSNPNYYRLTSDTDDYVPTVYGLNSGTTYKIHETKAPDSYNLLTTDISFTIESGTGTITYNTNDTAKSENEISSGTSTILNVVPVENSKGNPMPATGGIGVTIFYVVGGILVLAAAGVIVISKKRRTEK